MKIGIDARMYGKNFTGIGRYVYELSRNLFQIDKKNEYVLFFNEPEFSQFNGNNKRIQKRLVNAPHYSINEQIKFLKMLGKEKLDLMHFTHFNAPIGYSRPSVVTIHDLTLSFYPGKKMPSLLHRGAYHLVITSAIKKARKIIAVSEHTKKDLQKLFKLPKEKIEVIYEAVSADFNEIHDQKIFDGIKKKYALDKPFLLYTGVWRNHKNLVNLIRAFSLLTKQYGFDGYLIITGKEDPCYPEIKNETVKLQLEDRIKFTGLVPNEELVGLYNLAILYVFPSLYEGFGLPVLEAFACGTAVACSNLSSLPEVCGSESALFFNPFSPADMAEKIDLALRDEQLRGRMILKAKDRVKKFSWKKMAEETLRVYFDAKAS